jgi:hypothetical protein
VPPVPEATHTFYLLHLAHLDAQLEAVRAALLRDWLGVFALGGTYLVTTPIELYQRMLEACGFQRLPGATSRSWGSEHPAEGFLLDLTGVGVEAWIEAIMAGRRPPRRLEPDELRRELLSALLHWHDAGLPELAGCRTMASEGD